MGLVASKSLCLKTNKKQCKDVIIWNQFFNSSFICDKRHIVSHVIVALK